MNTVLPLGLILVWPIVAHTTDGIEAKAEAEAKVEAKTENESETEALDDPVVTPRSTNRADRPDRQSSASGERWIHRWAPERNMGELGAYGGIFSAGDQHELFEPDEMLPDQGFQRYPTAVAEIGARIGYYPSRFFGMEVEGGALPTETLDFERATMWNVRGSVVGQLGKWSITPFALVGTGAMGVSSKRSAVGNDVDPSLHFGGGMKIFLSRYAQVRVDVRDVVGNKLGVDQAFRNHSFEALLGVSVTLGRSRDKQPEGVCAAIDTDNDGWIDSIDECVAEPGVAPHGCPIRDSDGDGWLDDSDACVDEVGVAPAGCPLVDSDGDGLFDPDDQCVDQPESTNGFEDADGCPDELPAELEQFNGVMQGIRFHTAKARIMARSLPRLNEAAKVMLRFPEIRVEISGHTDNRGGALYNQDLSLRRAEAVKGYMVLQGIAPDRFETRGAGPNEPIAPNQTSPGRSQNRRIQFKVLTAHSDVQ